MTTGSPHAHREHSRESVLGRLGALLLDAGLPVTDVRESLMRINGDRGPRLAFAIMPELVIISQRDAVVPAAMCATEGELSFHQAARASQIAQRAEDGTTPLVLVPGLIDEVRAMSRRHPSLMWVAGSAIVSAGLALLTRSPWWTVLIALLAGALVGVVTTLMNRSSAAASIVPFVATLISTLLVGGFAHMIGVSEVPLFAVCAPIAILVPGALITNALIELTATDIVTGAARLVYGLVVLGFMVAGVMGGVILSGLRLDPHSAGLIGEPAAVTRAAGAGWGALPPAWLAWVGVVLLALGVGIAFGASVLLTAVCIVTMACAYGVLLALVPLLGKTVGTGAAAAVLFILSRVIARISSSAPAIVTFQPAFLLLVPGTVGLVAFASMDVTRVEQAVATFVSLCIGAKVGGLFTLLGARRPSATKEKTA